MDKPLKFNKFREIYTHLGIVERRAVRQEVCRGTAIEYYGFMRNLRNDSWTPFERDGINRILKEKGYGQI